MDTIIFVIGAYSKLVSSVLIVVETDFQRAFLKGVKNFKINEKNVNIIETPYQI